MSFHRVEKAALIYALVIMLFGWGYISAAYKVFPYYFVDSIITHVQKVAAGHEDEKETSFVEKLVNDFGGMPNRLISEKPQAAVFTDAPIKKTVTNQKQNATFEINSDGSVQGYFLFNSAFTNGTRSYYAVKLVDTNGKIHRSWKLRSEPNMAFALNRNTGHMYTVSVNNKGEIHQISWCNNRTVPTGFIGIHHTMEVAPDNTMWTLQNDGITQLDLDSLDKGKLKVIRRITIPELTELHEDLGILDTRINLKWDTKNDPEKKRPQRAIPGGYDASYHHNDVQPFTDPRFPTELGYALAVSLRNLNLVLVLDPVTKKILWWSQGLTQWQHDVDYYNGALYAYDNRPHRQWSHITRLDFDQPNTTTASVAVDGEGLKWHEPIKGSHSLFEQHGKLHHLILDERDGRFMVTDANGKMEYEFRNILDKDRTINIPHALWMTAAEVKKLNGTCQK